MTHKDRFLAVLNRQPVDELPVCESFWGDATSKWREQGHIAEGDDMVSHFDLSELSGGWLNSTADIDTPEQIVEETEETIVKITGNGATLRNWKHKSGTPEHVGFSVRDRSGWQEQIRPHLLEADRRRIPFKSYRTGKARAATEERMFCWAGVAPFEQMHPVCGHEYMLMGMALDPEWVSDMVQTYADFTIRHLELLFAEEGVPDALWFYEDMGFKEKPFMSPTMYEELVMPGHQKLFDYAHSLDRKVIVHSCGYVAPLVPGLIQAGMDCLQAMEVKAGMDLPTLYDTFGERISFCGGVDIREVETNDRARIDAEIDRAAGYVLKQGGHFIGHSDHSIPPTVEHDTARYFFEQLRTLPSRV